MDRAVRGSLLAPKRRGQCVRVPYDPRVRGPAPSGARRLAEGEP